jgi:class 3 adenylate cyclase
MSQTVRDSLEKGREAIRRHAWREAFELLSATDPSQLTAPDYEHLAEAAWWTGRLDACIDARERAYNIYLQQGNQRRAGSMALELAHDHEFKRALPIATGWQSKGERLLEQEPEGPEHGVLSRRRTNSAMGKGDFESALAHAKRTVDIGMKFGDRGLQAMGLHDQGRVLIAMGRADEGMALIDEATVAAVSGELEPLPTAVIYCNTIGTCRDMVDYQRAGQWSEAAKRWCDRQHIAGFPGMCRVYRAEIMRLRGEWTEAEQEARRACEELKDFCLDYAAGAFYEVGEIRLRIGDFPSAEAAFNQAHEIGKDPQPGLALLRLAQGKVSAAQASIRRALDETRDRLARARLLPAQVEIAIAAGDLETAQSAARELEDIATAYDTRALHAYAAYSRGVLQLAKGKAAEARSSLRESARHWQEIESPYEMARARLLLSTAYHAMGDLEDAQLELQAARSVFDRLGALPDLRRADEQLKETGTVGRGTAAGKQASRTFIFTDVVKSTPLIEAIGDAAWSDVVRWHDQTLRSLFAQHSGEVVDHAGDGFFVAFEDAGAAVDCAVAIQRALADHRRTQGFAPQVRIGLHASQVVRESGKYKGKGVHEAARIGALAEGGEIVVSSETLAGGPKRYAVGNQRTVTLKGLSQPVIVYSLDWRAPEQSP